MPGSGNRRRTRGARSSRAPNGDRDRDRDRETSVGGSDDARASPRSAVELFRGAQDAVAELKRLLQTGPPWAREAEATRQRARNAFLAVLFEHPLSPHAQSIEQLWLGTTHVLITACRDVIGRIEAALPSPAASRRKGGGGEAGAAGEAAWTDLRRTLTRFRAILVAEDAFYRSLISRLVAFYRLQDRTAQYLAHVGVPVAPLTPTTAPVDGLGSADRWDRAMANDPSLAPPLSREESEKKVAMVYKGLICLGDLERYKEQYSERARREARDGVPARGRDAAERFARAITFYEVARGLQPDTGMAFNQLAVIDGYVADNFHCTYHYFRALAVRQPFPGGEANLDRVLKKTFDRWRASRRATDSGQDVDVPTTPNLDTPRDDAETFKRDLLIAVSILFCKAGTSHLSPLRTSLVELFARLLRARELPSEIIVKTTAMVIGSHWHARLGVLGGVPGSGHEGGTSPDAVHGVDRRRSVEELALGFLLSIFTALIVVSAAEIDEVLATTQLEDDSALAIDEDAGDNDTDGIHLLARRITAVVRRILPSLRIMSRWLKSHLEYVVRAGVGANADLRATVATFWQEYKHLMIGFARLFPLVQLPSLEEPLEEDIDMRGFLPLRRGHTLSEDESELDNAGTHEVHPNEEQLMRISDLLVDVKLLMQTEAGSAALNSGTPLPSAPFVAPHNSDEAVSVSVSTETEDDPVNLAMRATLTEGSSIGDPQDIEEEEVIVWGRNSLTPVLQETSPSGPTAADMLQSLTIQPTHAQAHPHPAPNPPPLLFGGDVSGAGSIWTMSREESQQGAQRAAASHGQVKQPPNIATLWQTEPSPSHSRQPSSAPAGPPSWQQAGAPGHGAHDAAAHFGWPHAPHSAQAHPGHQNQNPLQAQQAQTHQYQHQHHQQNHHQHSQQHHQVPVQHQVRPAHAPHAPAPSPPMTNIWGSDGLPSLPGSTGTWGPPSVGYARPAPASQWARNAS